MIPELGHISLILAFVLSVISASLFFWRDTQAKTLAVSLNLVTLFCVIMSVMAMLASALADDFSVAYIANNANSHMPTIYKATMLWGAHEGSMLLWLLILCLWGQFLNLKSLNPLKVNAYSILGFLIACTSLFILATSNPFIRLMPVPIEGADLNPLLQDFAFIIHPPILYAGYVGLSIPMILAVCLIYLPQHKQIILSAMKQSALIAWSLLTVGIALGSWWAYYELGWGGWWFWDPVENASLMPWIASCGLVHVLIANQKKGHFPNLVIFMAILSFAMSLLGTFLVRSGVLSSVHTFASSPTRGAYILVYFAVTVGGAFYLHLKKINHDKQPIRVWSKELMILAQAAMMLVALATIMLGTLYPLIIDSLVGHKITVGAPYFNTIMMPLLLICLLMMTFGPYAYWGRANPKLKKFVLKASLIPIFASFVVWYITELAFNQALVACLAGYLGFVCLKSLSYKIYSPMNLAHLGFAIFAVAISLTTAYDVEQDLAMQTGQSATFNGYEFKVLGFREIDNPHYVAAIADITVSKDNQIIAKLSPEKRYYKAREIALSETAIKAGLYQDLYVALGEPLDNGWSMRIYLKPFVRWIWIGAAFMAIAGFMSGFKRIFKIKRATKYEANYGKV